LGTCESKGCTLDAELKVVAERLTNLTGNCVDDRISTKEMCLCSTHAKEADGKCLDRDGKGLIQYVTKTEPLEGG